jgi:pyruvate, orthophosphate dikinase
MVKYVYDFTEGDRSMVDLLGGKGANLAEMTRLGIPVPPGFIITTDACRAYLRDGREPAGLGPQVGTALAATESRSRRRFGDPADPLLLSVRSGARFSMPGMMETVLNIGLNDETLPGLVAQSGDERFAWDSYRRLIQMFGRTVLDIDPERFEHALEAQKKKSGAVTDVQLDVPSLQALVAEFRSIVVEETGSDFPQGVFQQLDLAIRAVFRSWNTERAKIYRRQERIADDIGTAVNIVTMVFGNRGETSGTGVAFTRDPASGLQGAYGDWLTNAQGEDVVAGIRNTLTLDDLGQLMPSMHSELMDVMQRLENHYKDLCDIEFTVESEKLWILQTRVGKRTPEAAFRIASQFVDEGVIDLDEALRRVTGAQLAHLMFPRFEIDPERKHMVKGLGASPGAAVGEIAFSSKRAQEMAAEGRTVILVRRETNPDDLGGMLVSAGILTTRGGRTSHAAVVARGLGKTAVCGAEDLDVDHQTGVLRAPGGIELREGERISIDGTTGEVFAGEAPVTRSQVMRYLEGDLNPEFDECDDVVRAVDRILQHADAVRTLGVRANADTGEDARVARVMGAQGIGLARTEHMFLGERRALVEELVLASSPEERVSVYERMLPLQVSDATDLLSAMDGLPVVIRLLDPPLHEFLPERTELSVEVALAQQAGTTDPRQVALLAAVNRMHEHNPMLGLRGVRLGLRMPGLYEVQVRAIAMATAQLISSGKSPHPEIMVPLVATIAELEPIRALAEEAIASVAAEYGVELTIPIGTMIELPRAALTAHRIARAADFFSFGTNDLTQTTWGFSRDDVESSFVADYLDRAILGTSPFESVDESGVGELMEIAADRGRHERPGLVLGVCGEHGGDPTSIHFFHSMGLDYVSASPFRVPVARLEAGRACLISRSPEGGSDSR